MLYYCRKKVLIAAAYLFFILTLFTYLVITIISTSKNNSNIMAIVENFATTSEPPLMPEDSQLTDRIVEQLNFVPSMLAERPVKIFVRRGGGGSVADGYREFDRQDCKVNNCFITSKAADISTADVVVIKDDDAMVSSENRVYRPAHQIWILQMLESPEHSNSLKHLRSLINYTATYRWDSDLVTPYERWVPCNRTTQHDKQLKRTTINYAKGKTKLIAWFVSHCQTTNRRLAYATHLKRYVQLDIYGLCGNLICPRTSHHCWQMLDTDYKFYLSFENSNCRDYVTEKYFVNGLQHNIIPIVMGADRAYYEKVSPPHSFIHTDDFENVRQLADYLQYLDRNDTAYNEYFRWKGEGQFINTKFWCRLCAMVQQPRPKIYDNIELWWNSPGVCKS